MGWNLRAASTTTAAKVTAQGETCLAPVHHHLPHLLEDDEVGVVGQPAERTLLAKDQEDISHASAGSG